MGFKKMLNPSYPGQKYKPHGGGSHGGNQHGMGTGMNSSSSYPMAHNHQNGSSGFAPPPPQPPPSSSYNNVGGYNNNPNQQQHYHQQPQVGTMATYGGTPGPGPPPSLNNPNEWFDYYDRDRSGTLDRDEVVSALVATIGPNGNPSIIRDTVYNVWVAFDYNQSGTIDKGEFCSRGGMGESLRASLESTSSQPQPQQQYQHQQYQPQQQQQYGGGGYGGGMSSSLAPPAAASMPPAYNPAMPPPPQNPSGSGGGGTWNCPRCTFINFDNKTTCGACASSRPPTVAGGGGVGGGGSSSVAAAMATQVTLPSGTSTTTTSYNLNNGGQLPQQQQQQQPFVVQGTVVMQPTNSSSVYGAPYAPHPQQQQQYHHPQQHQSMMVGGTNHTTEWQMFFGKSYVPPPVGLRSVPLNPHPIPPNGRMKALLVGINYRKTRAELRGCINDVKNIQDLLVRSGYPQDTCHLVALTDDKHQPEQYQPTRRNIMKGLQWLLHDVQPGDVLFFHFSGHGAQQRDKTGHEADGYNETILPSDYKRSGQITDDELWGTAVYPLPAGVRLTALMDCCHSGTGLDLPYDYDMRTRRWKEDVNPAHSAGDVVLLSGCEDSQTSADSYSRMSKEAGGAMTMAFTATYEKYVGSGCTYPNLLEGIRKNLQKRRFHQRPQLTTSQRFDVDRRVFTLGAVGGGQNEGNGNPQIGRMKRRHVRPSRMNTGGGAQMSDLLFGAGVMAIAGAMLGD